MPVIAQAGDLFQLMMMMTLIFVIVYFLLVRPEQKRRQQHEERVSKLKKGDRIVTAGGIYATIIGIKDEAAAIKINDEVKIEIRRSAIAEILEPDEQNKR